MPYAMHHTQLMLYAHTPCHVHTPHTICLPHHTCAASYLPHIIRTSRHGDLTQHICATIDMLHHTLHHIHIRPYHTKVYTRYVVCTLLHTNALHNCVLAYTCCIKCILLMHTDHTFTIQTIHHMHKTTGSSHHTYIHTHVHYIIGSFTTPDHAPWP